MIYHKCLLRILTGLLCIVSFAVKAGPLDEAVRKGDFSYKRKAFDSAVIYYEQAIEMDRDNAMLYYKLGNAHYRLKQTGPAVLAYEKALKRRPGFVEAANNLAIAQEKVDYRSNSEQVFFIRWWRALTRPANSNAWAIVSFIAFCLPLGLLVYSRYSKKHLSWLSPQLITGGIAIGILAAVMGIAAATSGLSDNAAVVMRADATIKLDAAGADKPSVVALQEGSIVTVERKTSQYWQVSLEDGRTGQISSNYLSLVD